MNRNAIPKEHPDQLQAYLTALSLDDLIDLTELATKVFSRGQSVYNHNLMKPDTKVQTLYVYDMEVLFELIRERMKNIRNDSHGC